MSLQIYYKTLLEIAEVNIGVSDDKNKTIQRYKYKCVMSSHLLENNQFSKPETVLRSSQINSNAFLRVNDILIKRLNPSNINIISHNMENTFASGNIIIIRPKGKVNAKYIACVLEIQGIPALQHNTARGVTVQTISISELKNVKIPILLIEKQIAMGELWLWGKEKQRLLNLLADKENKYMKYIFNNMLKYNGGCNYGDNQRRY